MPTLTRTPRVPTELDSGALGATTFGNATQPASSADPALGARLAAARKQAGRSQQQVADLMGTTQSAVARLEAGSDARMSTLTRFMRALDGGAELDLTLPTRPATVAQRGIVVTIAGRSDRHRLTTALLAGAELTARCLRVCLIDTDIQYGQLARFVTDNAPPTVAQLRAPNPTPTELADCLTSDEGYGQFLLPPLDPSQANPLHYTGRRYQQIVEAARALADVVILIGPPSELFHDMYRECLLRESDRVFAVTGCGAGELDQTHRWLDALATPDFPLAHPAAVRVLPVRDPGAGPAPARADCGSGPRWTSLPAQHFTPDLAQWWARASAPPTGPRTVTYRATMAEAILDSVPRSTPLEWTDIDDGAGRKDQTASR